MSNVVNVDFITKVVEIEVNDNETESLAAMAAVNAAKRADEKVAVAIDEIDDFTDTKKSELQVYVDNAATSATAAANSASAANTTATALTNFLETKETLTAPAVDPTLTISGAAADAKATGEKLKVALYSVPITADDVVDGFVYGAVGTFSDSTSYKRTNYMSIHDNVAGLLINVRCILFLNAGFSFYDAHKKFISGYSGASLPTGDTEGTHERWVAIPQNAEYIVLSMSASDYTASTDFKIEYLKIDGLKNTVEIANNLNEYADLFIQRFEFSFGTLANPSLTQRANTGKFCIEKGSQLVSVNPTQQYVIVYFGADGSGEPQALVAVWTNISNGYVFPYTGYFGIEIRYSDDRTLTVDDLDYLDENIVCVRMNTQVNSMVDSLNEFNENIVVYSQSMTNSLVIDDAYIDGTNGTQNTSSHYKCTSLIPINSAAPGHKIIVYCTFSGGAGLAFYTFDNKYISGINGNNASTYGFSSGTDTRYIPVPEEAVYIRFTLAADKYLEPSSFVLKYNKVLSNKVLHVEDIVYKQLGFVRKSIDNTTGEVFDSTGGFATSDMFEVFPGTIIRNTMTGAKIKMYHYDINGNYINPLDVYYLSMQVWEAWETYVSSRHEKLRLLVKPDPERVWQMSEVNVYIPHNLYIEKLNKETIPAIWQSIDNCNVPAYWNAHLATKEDTILQHIIDCHRHGDSFIFITDVHLENNYLHSNALMRHIYEKTGVDKIICGGDLITGLPKKKYAIAHLNRWRELTNYCKTFFVMGNHDNNTAVHTITAENYITESEMYGLLYKRNESFVGNPGQLYYYYDNVPQKIRYIVLDSGGVTVTEDYVPQATQMAWLRTVIGELDNEWTILIFQHIIYQDKIGPRDPWGVALTDTLDDIVSHFTISSPTIAAAICGHAHFSWSTVRPAGYLCIVTTCDAAGSMADTDDECPNRVEGTTTEHAFDVFTIDTQRRKIYATRIGAGADREWSY